MNNKFGHKKYKSKPTNNDNNNNDNSNNDNNNNKTITIISSNTSHKTKLFREFDKE